MLLALSSLLIILGMVFLLGGSVGILRLPDFYTRMHPAGKLDSMGSLLVNLGVAIYVALDFNLANLLTSIKVLLIAVFIYLSSPTATHCIVDAAIRAGLEPWKKE
ncbi:MAG: monovalent cation/H(+) antiporter subunit G [Desulfatiglandales bacterium]